MSNNVNIEDRIKEIGNEIYLSLGGGVPSIFDTGKWKGKLMAAAMEDESYKMQLFRFIDVLPSLKDSSLVFKLLNQYFSDGHGASNLLLRGFTRVAAKAPMPHLAAKVVVSGIESFARQFIAGATAQDVLAASKKMRDEGFAFSLDILGEAVLSHAEVQGYTARYLDLLTTLGPIIGKWSTVPILDSDHRGPIPRWDVSLKISSFDSQLDPTDWDGSIARAVKGVAPVLEMAKQWSAGVTLDMESYYYKDLTIAIFKRLAELHPNLPAVGIALQAYLKDTKADLDALVDWARKKGLSIGLRLVKGAYWDYETVLSKQKGWPCPVFLSKEETDRNYEVLATVLLKNVSHIRPAIATHNIRTISHAAAVAESLGLPKSAFEFQSLYGMAEPIRHSLKNKGYRVRVYTPVGQLIPGMAYFIRRLLENTSNESFLRKSFADKRPFEELIRPPEVVTASHAEEVSVEVFRNEPHFDFSKSENREYMKEALGETKLMFGKRYPLFIDSNEVRSDKESPSLNPARPSEVVGMVSQAAVDHVDRAILAARNAWKNWSRTSVNERSRFLVQAAARMRKKRFRLAALQVYEVGKSWQEADADVAEAIDFLEYYAREMLRLDVASLVTSFPGEDNRYLYQPKGIGVVISPWNFPLAIPAGMVSAAVVTGNCVIFKPSSLSPVLGWELVRAFHEAGLPSGVLQFLPGSGEEIGEYLVSHPQVNLIAFTGSLDAGLRIMQRAAMCHPEQNSVKTVIAEMGGKNAIIVDETADLDEAVRGVLQSAFGYQGQKCSACSRVIPVGYVFEEFCERLVQAIESIAIGDPEDPGNTMGPLIDEKAVEKVRHYVRLGMEQATPLLMKEINLDGYFVGPTVFADVDPASPLAREEIFGPVLAIFRAPDIDSAVELANNTSYGLTGGIYSRSPENIGKVRNKLRVGNLYINRKITGALVGRQPFGGIGMSGLGTKAGGPDYLLQFMHAQSICENTMRRGFAPTSE